MGGKGFFSHPDFPLLPPSPAAEKQGEGRAAGRDDPSL